MVFRTDFRVTTRGDPADSRELLVNGRLLELPKISEKDFKLPKGEHYYGNEVVLEVSPLSILFSVFERTC